MPIVSVEFNRLRGRQVIVTNEVTVEPRIPNPSQADVDDCPDSFRCAVCLKMRPKRLYAEGSAEARVCLLCFPYVEPKEVGWLVRFDEIHRTHKGATGIPAFTQTKEPNPDEERRDLVGVWYETYQEWREDADNKRSVLLVGEWARRGFMVKPK